MKSFRDLLNFAARNSEAGYIVPYIGKGLRMWLPDSELPQYTIVSKQCAILAFVEGPPGILRVSDVSKVTPPVLRFWGDEKHFDLGAEITELMDAYPGNADIERVVHALLHEADTINQR